LRIAREQRARSSPSSLNRPPPQVTSPIRRYNDLLAHYQLKAALLGRTPPHSCQTLQLACERAADVLRDYGRLETDCRQHFLAYHFAANPRATYDAEFLAHPGKAPALAPVLVRMLGVEAKVAVPTGVSAVPGGRCRLRIRDNNVSAGSYTWEVVS